MARNANKWARKDRRREARNAGRNRKMAWFMLSAALAFVGTLPVHGNAYAVETAGMESPWYTAIHLGTGGQEPRVVAMYLDLPDCLGIAEWYGNTICRPMGIISALDD